MQGITQVWAFANLGLDPGNKLFEGIAMAAVPALPEFSPQNVANLLWAFAKLGHRNEPLFAAAAVHAKHAAPHFQPQSVVCSLKKLSLCVGHATMTLQCTRWLKRQSVECSIRDAFRATCTIPATAIHISLLSYLA